MKKTIAISVAAGIIATAFVLWLDFPNLRCSYNYAPPEAGLVIWSLYVCILFSWAAFLILEFIELFTDFLTWQYHLPVEDMDSQQLPVNQQRHACINLSYPKCNYRSKEQ